MSVDRQVSVRERISKALSVMNSFNKVGLSQSELIELADLMFRSENFKVEKVFGPGLNSTSPERIKSRPKKRLWDGQN